MLRLTVSILLIIGLLQLNYSQSKIQQIKPEKILYKNTKEGELNLLYINLQNLISKKNIVV